MPSFAEGFLTGFMKDQTEVIRKRKDDAEVYFQTQMELARTRGLKNKDLTKKVMDGNLQIAKQLQMVGVPKDLIMSVAKQNPDDLPNVLKQIQDLQAEGVTPDESFYRDLFQVSNDYKAPDEDLSTFMRNLYEPIRNNAQAAPEGATGSDSIWATMFGVNAMDRARGKLDETVVADGMTAGELLRYSDDPTPDTTGAPSVIMDAGMIGDETRAARQRLKGTSPLTPSETTSINNAFQGYVDAAKSKVREAWIKAHPEAENPSDSEIPGFEQMAERIAAEKLLEIYRPEDLAQIPRIYKYISEQEEISDEPPIISDIAPAAPNNPSNVAPPVQEVVPPRTPIPSGVPPALADGSTYYDMADDGTIVYIGKDGKPFRVRPEMLGISNPDIGFDVNEILRNPTGN